MDTVRHLFLDLEDTVISPVLNGWSNVELLSGNVAKVKQLMAEFQPTSVSLFSFAIWDQAQLSSFNRFTRAWLENHLGVALSMVPTVDDDIIPFCNAQKRIGPGATDFMEASKFWGKHDSFRLFVRQKFKDNWKNWGIETEVALMDDAVWNEKFEFPDLHLKRTIININET